MKQIVNGLMLCACFALFALPACRNNAPEKKSTYNPNDCTEYACPMHPDKTSTGKARCPQCGMDMQPRIKKGSECDTSGSGESNQ